jgi:T4 RnlA family RNA ligase
MFYLPDYKECVDICEKSEGIFYESKFVIDGFPISVFNYRLSTYEDFFKYNAFELRGLTFVFNHDGSLYKRFLLMEKFFNLNENGSTSYDILKDKKIKSVYLKEDGSVINFIMLPNGKIVAKSKASFDSEQALSSQNLINKNENLRKDIESFLKSDISPIFELVGPKNRIVVKYDTSDLVLLRLRENKTGKYLPISNHSISTPKSFDYDLSKTVELKSKEIGIEGWVVEFEDGLKVKVKTDWYYSLHRIFTEYVYREDYLIEMVLDEKIDDILSLLENNSESKNFVNSLMGKTISNVQKISNEVDILYSKFNGDKKSFAINNHKNEYFTIVMSMINGREKMSLINSHIKKQTYRLSDARTWLNL